MFTGLVKANTAASSSELCSKDSKSWPFYPTTISASPWEGLYDASTSLGTEVSEDFSKGTPR